MNQTKTIYFYLLFIFTLGLVVIFWWQSSGAFFLANENNALIALGRLSGLLAAYFVLLQLVLIGRPRWLEPVFGLDKLSRVHHLNGVYLMVFLLAHPVFLAWGYGGLSQTPFLSQLLNFITGWKDVIFAAIALGLFIFIVGYSIFLYRAKIKYEYWYFTHLFNYLAILLAFGHQLEVGGDLQRNNFAFHLYWQLLYIFAFGNIFIFRFLRPALNLHKHRFTVDQVVAETKDVTSIYITGQQMEKFKVLPGQFMIFRFLEKNFKWQAHPFSLSGRPDQDHLRISVKDVGDYTSQIKNLKPGVKVFIDGPHGTFTAQTAKKDKLLLIAGGIGITPIRSLIEQLAKEGKDMILLYGNRTEKDIAFRKELDDLSRQHGFPVHHVLSRDNAWSGEKGYIDREKVLRLVPDVKEREVFLCGPVPMMKKVAADLGSLGIGAAFIHFEKFSL